MAALAADRASRWWSRLGAVAVSTTRVAAGAAAALESFVFPARCPACGAPADAARVLCDACELDIPRFDGRLCARCLALERDPDACLTHRGFACWCAWIYEERAAQLIHALKYEGRAALAARLGRRLAQALPVDYRPDLVIEVPMHAARLRERGFNQAARLAAACAAQLQAPRLPGALLRVRATRPQTGLSARERRRNLTGAFQVREGGALRGRKVLLVDDVITTGSTLEACLDALRACGAEAVAAVVAWAS